MARSEEHTSELQSRLHLVCRLLLEKKKKTTICAHHPVSIFFFFNDTATTEIYTLSLHDALPICQEVIDPPFDREDVETELLDRDLALPAVVDEWAHPHLAPFLFRLMAMQRDGEIGRAHV